MPSLSEMIEQQRGAGKARRHNHEREHRLQTACVKWFRLQYPKLSRRLFAVPNGGYRGKATAGKMKAEGVLAGVSDLILLACRGGYGALLIEMKTTEKGSAQSREQKEWQHDVIREGEYRYVVCRTIDEFMTEVRAYLEAAEGGSVKDAEASEKGASDE